MSSSCTKFIQRSRDYERHWRDRYYAKKNGADDWYELIHEHIERKFLPRLKHSSEVFIEYWPVWFVIGREHYLKSGILTDNLFLHEYGAVGTGYISITSQKIYIATLNQLAKKYPLETTSALSVLFNAINREIDGKRPIQEDRVWEIEKNEFTGSQIMLDRHGNSIIKLKTTTINWDIYPHFSNQKNTIQEALTCFRFGYFDSLRPRHYIHKRPIIYSQPLRVSKLKKPTHEKIASSMENFEETKGYIIYAERELPDKLPPSLIFTIDVEKATRLLDGNAPVSVNFSVDNSYLYVYTRRGEVLVFDSSTKQFLTSWETFSDHIYPGSGKFLVSDKYLVSITPLKDESNSTQREVKIWDATTWKFVKKFLLNRDQVQVAIATLSEDGRILAIPHKYEKRIHLYYLEGGAEEIIELNECKPERIKFGPRGKWLAVLEMPDSWETKPIYIFDMILNQINLSLP